METRVSNWSCVFVAGAQGDFDEDSELCPRSPTTSDIWWEQEHALEALLEEDATRPSLRDDIFAIAPVVSLADVVSQADQPGAGQLIKHDGDEPGEFRGIVLPDGRRFSHIDDHHRPTASDIANEEKLGLEDADTSTATSTEAIARLVEEADALSEDDGQERAWVDEQRRRRLRLVSQRMDNYGCLDEYCDAHRRRRAPGAKGKVYPTPPPTPPHDAVPQSHS